MAGRFGNRLRHAVRGRADGRPAERDRGVDRWDDQVRVLGEILGRSDDAETIIADREAEIAAAALPGLAGRTGVLSQYMFGQGQFVVVADPNDGAAALFEQLGMTLPPSLVEEAGISQGRLMFSPERSMRSSRTC